jgi:hypothetical protein
MKILINGISLDPTAQAAQLASRSLLAADSSKSDYILAQTKEPLTKDQKQQLSAIGVKLLEYVPDNTYICRYEPADLAKVRALPFVTWANVYMKGFKVAPALHSSNAPKVMNLLDKQGLPGGAAEDTQLVDVVVHRGVDVNAVKSEVAAAAGVDASTLQASGGKFRLRVPARRLDKLADIDEVRHIEPVFEKRLWNNVAGPILGADVAHQRSDVAGEGEVIAVCDTGFDNGDPENPHPAFEGRVLHIYALGRSTTGSDPDGHGTHVCGSAAGDGTSTVLGPIAGTAPRAKLVVQSVLDAQGGLGGIPAHLGDLFTPPYTEFGARVHSNSWGDDNNAYTEEAREVDDFVWNNRDAVVVFAAGNAGKDANGNGVVDAGSVGSPGTAKNCITVGASENNRPEFNYVDGSTSIGTYGEGWPDDYPVPPLSDDRLADNPEGLAAFSSRGPTSDGRIKPDVVAPGTAILSTRSRAVGVGNGWGPSEDALYFFDGGTSMATPLVAGCTALVRQYLQRTGNPRPSAALVKALLINGAHDLTGQYSPTETGPIPNNNEGFGRVNLPAILGPLPDGVLLKMWDESTALDTGEEQTFQVELESLAKLVKVTLVWTDSPGETLQNDLDLIVKTSKGTVRHGNMGSSPTRFDRSNNVEQVSMTTVLKGTVTVTVRAFRAAVSPQSFALVFRAIS